MYLLSIRYEQKLSANIILSNKCDLIKYLDILANVY